jgi:hypothetical protein
MISPQSNNSFNRSGNSVAFIRETSLFVPAIAARLIRAFGGALNQPGVD